MLTRLELQDVEITGTLCELSQLETMDMRFNTLRPKQSGRHSPEDIFKYIFLNENVWISLTISLEFVPKVLISNIPALVQITARHQPGDMPLSERCLVYWCIYASLGLNGLTNGVKYQSWHH